MGNKIKTVIASVLKPVDDTRMYEKFGLSLQQTYRYEVNIIGFISKNPPEDRDIGFYPIFNFRNSSWKRFFAPFRFGKYLLKIAPSLVIVTTFELLPIAILYKLFNHRAQLVYDVRENYALNFETNRQHHFSTKIFAKAIRGLESSSQRFVRLNILAEISYAKEIKFLAKNSICILNKYKAIDIDNDNDNKASGIPSVTMQKAANSQPVLLFNGTVSENYGIHEAIALAKSLAKEYPKLILIIVGHVTNNKLLTNLLNLEKECSYLMTKIDEDPIPHVEIMKLIEFADFGLVAHHPVESIKNCFPTRIYEYMAHKKPFILQDHPYWTSYCNPWKCSINIDFKNFDSSFVAQQMKSRQFYPNGIPKDIYWDSEAAKLIQAMDHLISSRN